jgi:hypothetical protein
VFLEELNNLEWLEPWHQQDLSGLLAELGREVSVNPPLFGIKATPIARGDGDDVLFYLHNYKVPLAVVHLTGQKESSSDFPFTNFYSSIEDFVKNCMKSDHENYVEITNDDN